MSLEIVEVGGSSHWLLCFESGSQWVPDTVRLRTRRPDGAAQIFGFTKRGDCLLSLDSVPEPYTFEVHLRLGKSTHSHAFDFSFVDHRCKPQTRIMRNDRIASRN